MDFSLLQVRGDDPASTARRPTGALRRGFASIRFECDGEVKYYDLRGSGKTLRQFENYAKREFGYLAYTIAEGV